MLRHQPPLQPVGQTRNDAGKIGQLLVQIGAKPGQFLGITQLVGINGFIKGGGKDLIGRLAPAGILGLWPCWLGSVPHIGRLVAHFGFAVILGLALFVAGLAVGFGAVALLHRGCVLALALTLAVIALIVWGFLLVIGLVFIGFRGIGLVLIAHIQIA